MNAIKDNLIEYEEYYLIKENIILKIFIIKLENKIIIQYKNYSIQFHIRELSKLIQLNINSINEAYEYIINLFDNFKIYIKEIINNKTIKLAILNEEKEFNLIYNKGNKYTIIDELSNYYNKLIVDINNLKKEIDEMKINNKTINLKKHINYKISKEIYFNINSNLENNPFYIQFSKDLISNSYSHYALDNTFCIFKSIINIIYIIYATKKKSIISYNFVSGQKIAEIKKAHNEYITNFRHFLDKNNERDLIISIASDENNIKLWDVYNWNCLCDIKNINLKGNLHSGCFLNDNNNNYIITSNDNYSNSESIKIYDFNGNKIKEINNSNNRTFFIDTYFDNQLSKIFIITGNYSFVVSYDYKENIIFHKYFDKDNIPEDHDSIIIINNENIVKMIESSEDGNIRIWNFHSGILLNKIIASEHKLYGIYLWNNDFLFAACDDMTIKIINLKKEIIINNLMINNTIINIKKFFHPIYGNCLITQDWRNHIKLWINKE